MGKGGYNGGGTVIGRKNKDWFGHDHSAPKSSAKLTPDERVRRIAELDQEGASLRTRLENVYAKLRALREQQRANEVLQTQKLVARQANARAGFATDRQDDSLSKAIENLFGKRP